MSATMSRAICFTVKSYYFTVLESVKSVDEFRGISINHSGWNADGTCRGVSSRTFVSFEV